LELFNLSYLQSQYFWTTLAFLVLLGIMARFVVPAVNAVLDARAAQIKADLDKASQEWAQAERVLAEYQAQMKKARAEAAEVISTARAEAEALAKQRLADVEAELGRKAEHARLSIEAARQQALREVQAEVAKLTVKVAEKLLQTSVDDKTARRLTDEALRRGIQ
jgi:F-type H+-transporting ATPase subunit b